uniref:Uncharacterized protein n=1 Tax=Candidatus Kentrum sp. MB TaxID=2138164 RepID=A0A450XBZ0_9GAMM|nr:MAG: hypothetical protein BECKMB1821G_GA0114241_10239 [Candidatus Kentron sp. MB]VFK35653.1 MAG: hypothetical protein BECKMB1821I_GA0114274_11351 [Candidatus Kentron sp. MB]VFK77455.1 MAG: hypothetical protein BECKMB1821H_GA0114242_11421 [Candidatus Kentron sp. MB]
MSVFIGKRGSPHIDPQAVELGDQRNDEDHQCEFGNIQCRALLCHDVTGKFSRKAASS